MKKFIFLILSILAMTQTTSAQNYQNSRIDNFMAYLSAHGAKVSVSRVNDQYHIAKRYNVILEKDSILSKNESSNVRVPEIVDSACTFFDQMIRHSVESYRYESHKNGMDTITYSMAMKGYGQDGDYLLDDSRYENAKFAWTNDYKYFRKAHSFLYNNAFVKQERDFYKRLSGSSRKMYFGAKEAGLFDYVNGLGNLIYISNYDNTVDGTYFNFDMSSVDTTMNEMLKDCPKIKKVQVTYKHDASEGNDKETTYYHSEYIETYKMDSESEGTLYIIPASASSSDIYDKLLCEANKHLDTKLDQCCTLEYTDRHFLLTGVKNTVKLTMTNRSNSNPSNARLKRAFMKLADDYRPKSSLLLARKDKMSNVFILRLETSGECWIPRNWHNIKSAINGKITFIK